MAKHFRASTYGSGGGAPNLPNTVNGGGQMAFGRYLGFVLGPESVHARVTVFAGENIELGPGGVVPIPPWEGNPVIGCREVLPSDMAALHVIGLTECYELAMAPPRRLAFDWIVPITLSGAGTQNFSFPFGRRHALITARGAAGCTLGVTGRSDGAFYAPIITLAAGQPFDGAGNTIGYHIGGTDNEEPWPLIGVSVTSTGVANGELRFMAFGEPGG